MTIRMYKVTYTIKGIAYGFEWVYASNVEEARRRAAAYMKEDGIVCDPGSLRVIRDRRYGLSL